MASGYFACLTTILKQEIPTCMHSYCNFVKIKIIQSIVNFKNLKSIHFLSACFLKCLVVLRVWFQNFYTTNIIMSDLQNCCSNECLSTAPESLFKVIL